VAGWRRDPNIRESPNGRLTRYEYHSNGKLLRIEPLSWNGPVDFMRWQKESMVWDTPDEQAEWDRRCDSIIVALGEVGFEE
jgi:hypothetical protein